ncbi:MAG: transposase [Variovorax sp.]|nr:transposase [Variovorax sp.]
MPCRKRHPLRHPGERPLPCALDAYRHRWQIECLFADTKTRGFNIGDTRLTNPQKLSLLLAILALALAWTHAARRLSSQPATSTAPLMAIGENPGSDPDSIFSDIGS